MVVRGHRREAKPTLIARERATTSTRTTNAAQPAPRAISPNPEILGPLPLILGIGTNSSSQGSLTIRQRWIRGKWRKSVRTNPISAPRSNDESRDFGRTNPISAPRLNDAKGCRDGLCCQLSPPNRRAERTQFGLVRRMLGAEGFPERRAEIREFQGRRSRLPPVAPSGLKIDGFVQTNPISGPRLNEATFCRYHVYVQRRPPKRRAERTQSGGVRGNFGVRGSSWRAPDGRRRSRG